MKNQLNRIALIAGLAALPALTSVAQPYYIVGDVVNGWADPGAVLITSNSPTLWSYVVTNGTPGNYEELKVTAGDWGTAWPSQNLKLKLDTGGSNTVYFFPGSSSDGWSPLANRVGYEDPGSMSWEAVGDFNGWPGEGFFGTAMTALGGGVYSNSVTVATAGSHELKFRTPGTWNEVSFGVDFGNGSSNIPFTTTNSPQSVPVVIDVPNGRFLVGDLLPPPVTNEVVFLVDMSVEILRGAFVPGTDTVFVSGAFNGWPGTGAGALVLTNEPTWGGNTNIYYATNQFIGTPGSTATEYKFTDNNVALSGSSGYEPIGPNRTFSLLSSNGTLVLPVVNFGDSLLSDYTTEDMMVTFRIDMAGRTNTFGVTFDPSAHFGPYLNGNMLPGGWVAWNPLELSSYTMTEDPVGSTNYVITLSVPKGSFVRMQYKYAFDDSSTNSIDNEAPSMQDHVRYIRTTATGVYTNAQDTFGDQYGEPSYGELAIGPASGGMVPVSWLGRPGVTLEDAASIPGTWTEHVDTDGTNWSAGVESANGLVSVTNVPLGSTSQYFRLNKH